MNRITLALMLIPLAACDQRRDGPNVAERAAERVMQRDALENPAGRYQMMPNPGGEGFIVLDTRVGLARHCGVAPPQLACGPKVNVGQ